MKLKTTIWRTTTLVLTLMSTIPARADSVLHVGDVFSDGAKLVKVERLPQTPDGLVFGSNGREYRDDDVRAHIQALDRTPSSKFILLYSGGTTRDAANHMHVRRVLAELRAADGTLVGYEVAEERGTSILKTVDLETGRIAKLHPQVIEGRTLGAVVRGAPPEVEVDTNWGTIESSLKSELSVPRDRDNVAGFIEAARERQNYGHTALGKYYVGTFSEMIRQSPLRSPRLIQILERESTTLRTEATLATEAVRAVESAR